MAIEVEIKGLSWLRIGRDLGLLWLRTVIEIWDFGRDFGSIEVKDLSLYWDSRAL